MGYHFAMKFADILDCLGNRLHLGCVMAAGQDWVEVSLPEKMELGGGLQVRFHPSTDLHRVSVRWREIDRVGLTYRDGGPLEELFAGLPGLFDPRSSLHILQERSGGHAS